MNANWEGGAHWLFLKHHSSIRGNRMPGLWAVKGITDLWNMPF